MQTATQTLDQPDAARVKETVVAHCNGALLSAKRPCDDVLQFEVEKNVIPAVVESLVNELQARYLISVGTDKRPLTGDFGISHLFSLDRDHLFIVLDSAVKEADLRIQSITGIVPGANWAEREFRDVVGVEPQGHPDPRRLLLADDWPDGVYPLRRDVPYNYQPPPSAAACPELHEPPPGASVLPIGPFYPVLEEPVHWRLFVEGEKIVGCDVRNFYNHRGIEKLGDSVLTYNEIPQLAERICGICGFIHSTCYCQAVEKAAGLEIPARARYIRTMMLELERIHSHLLWLGIAGHIIGFDTVLMQTWRIREPVMWICEEISGNRKTYGMNTIGGLRRDFPDQLKPRLLEILEKVEKESVAVRDAIVGDTTLLARTKGVGVLTNDWAKKICTVGPPARASGVAIDARLDHPYAAYSELPPRMAKREEGDTWARVLVRVEELLESIRLVRQAILLIPIGPICAELRGEIPPGRIGVSVVEAPRGEAIHFVLTGGENRPYRWRVRAPTYPNLQALPAMIQNETIADVPITLGSLDPCFSCTERLETFDRLSHQVKIYSKAELLQISQRRFRGGGSS
jgi:Ni,Fe-hydrogenase III large subunit/Ni,Fe-hydrogenase III component G